MTSLSLPQLYSVNLKMSRGCNKNEAYSHLTTFENKTLIVLQGILQNNYFKL